MDPASKEDLTCSIQEAADILNVSKRWLLLRLADGSIPCRHVMDYKQKSREAFEKAMEELAALNQEMGLDD